MPQIPRNARKRFTGWLVQLVFLTAPGVAAATPGPQSAVVFVLDSSGHPVAGALVRMYDDDRDIDLSAKPLANEVTDRAGRAALNWNSARPVRALVSAPGHRLTAEAVSDLNKPVVLERGRDVAFEIRDEDVAPGQVVWNVTPRVRVAVSSDARGKGILQGLPTHAVSVTVKSGQIELVQAVEPEMGGVIFRMPPSAVVEGSVLDERGQPLSGARVAMTRSKVHEIAVGESGRFRVTGLAAGRYELDVAAPDHRTELIEVTIAKGELLKLPPVILRRGSEVVARFLDALAGQPIPSPTVILESNDPAGFSIRDLMKSRRRYTGAPDGVIAIRDLALGSARLVLDTPPFARLRLPAVEIADEAAYIDLGMLYVNRGTVLQVTVLDRGGNARSDVPVRLDQGPALSPVHPLSTTTDTAGEAYFDRLGPGRHRLRVGGDERPGGTTSVFEEWVVVDDAEQKIARRVLIGGVSLTVSLYGAAGPVIGSSVAVLASTESPDAGVRGLVVQTKDRMINVPFRRGSRGVTDADGRVTLSDVPTGPGTLSVTLQGSSWSRPLIVEERDSEAVLFLPPGTLSVGVRDRQSGHAVPAQVSWETRSGLRISGLSDTDGMVVLSGVPEEPGIFRVRAPEYEPLNVEHHGPSDVPPEILLDRTIPTILQCRIVGVDGRPLTDAALELVQPDTASWRRFKLTDPNGRAVFGNVEPGPARLVVRRSGYASVVRPDLLLRKGVNELGDMQLVRGYRVKVISESDGRTHPELYRLRVLDGRGVSIGEGLDEMSPHSVAVGGEASIGPLAPGRYTVELVGRSRTARESLRIEDSDVEIRVR